MYLQSLVIRILDVASRASGSDCVMHHVSAQIGLPVEHLAVDLVYRVVHVGDMIYNVLSAEDVTLLAQLAAVQHVVYRRFLFFRPLLRSTWSFDREGQSAVLCCRTAFRLRRTASGLLVLDREVLSQI